ncbi:unnamed protein product [Didymodactylos carnosus]|uniref:MATH domain-containing protein n=1 Tax=Didymodactylos carnosus TaxID=1234261 RepID=A0A8S2NA53_9BILA|nr:unnamed protein product [Didymodactylos carnosus]CAF3993921.1 unnamed protein product [Didymodactylos carnosus]
MSERNTITFLVHASMKNEENVDSPVLFDDIYLCKLAIEASVNDRIRLILPAISRTVEYLPRLLSLSQILIVFIYITNGTPELIVNECIKFSTQSSKIRKPIYEETLSAYLYTDQATKINEFGDGGIEFQKVTCPICFEITPTNEILFDRGFGRQILNLSIVCIEKINGCKWTGTLKEYKAHSETHVEENRECEYCNEICPSKYLLAEHQKHLCTKVTELCPLASNGCSKEKLRLHENKLTTDETSKLSDSVSLLSTAGSSLLTASAINDFYSQLQQFYEMLSIRTNNIETLNEETIRLSRESLYRENQSQFCQTEINQIKQSVVEKDLYVAGISSNYEVLQQETSSLKQKIEDLKSVCFDGFFTWKIDNVSEKMADAQSERQTSIYSTPFYSSPTGYKMRLRLYLQGDGNARRTNMSLFFLLMRGRYDAILKWPFNFKVTFCLFDQSGQQRHIIDSFRPDIKSNSFHRPCSEMNIASGIPKFIPLQMILQDNNNYIKDDIMYIKCQIDFNDIPKVIQPYALSLNPALPHSVQRNMIREEIERRRQSEQLEQSASATTITTGNANNNFQMFTDQLNNHTSNIVQNDTNSQFGSLNPTQNIPVMDSNQTLIMGAHSSLQQQ